MVNRRKTVYYNLEYRYIKYQNELFANMRTPLPRHRSHNNIKTDLGQQGMMVWTVFNWLRIG
jgi:hypothetical protein